MMRTVLRMASVAAIAGGGHTPYPTVAGDRVFDSRLDAIKDIKPNEFKAAVVLRTDEDRYRERGTKARAVDLRLELSMVRAVAERTGVTVTGWCETDAQQEAFLDLLELQVRESLFGFGKWASWFKRQGFAILEQDVISTPVFTNVQEGRARLAVRELTFPMALQWDCYRQPHVYGDPSKYPADDLIPIDTSGDPVLPREPLPKALTDMFAYLKQNATGAVLKMSEGIRQKFEALEMASPGAYPLLKTVSYQTPGPETNSLGAPTQTDTTISL